MRLFVDFFSVLYEHYLSVHPSISYEMGGQVESVVYSQDTSKDACYCHIAINDLSSSRHLFYHEIHRQQMCKFAEKCKDLKIPVKVTAEAALIGPNPILTIEYGNTSAKWWII